MKQASESDPAACIQNSVLQAPPVSKPVGELIWGPAALTARRDAIRRHQAKYARMREKWIGRNAYFYNSIKRVLRFIIEPQKRVLNVRCQTGFLLDAVNPSRGVGVEVSEEMVAIAQQSYPQFEFVTADPDRLDLDEKFDYILFEYVSDTVDVLAALQRLKRLCEPHTRLVIYTYNHLWEPVVTLAERLHLKMPMLEQNWLSEADLRNLLEISGFEWLRTYQVVLVPKWIPLLSEFFNRFVARLPGLSRLCMVNVLVGRPAPIPRKLDSVSVSVIIPCKNESGNIVPAIQRLPNMGKHTEIIFCDDKSTDGTAEEVRRMQDQYPERDIQLVEGPGICKAENVWAGFESAKGDVLMILDGDLAVMPEELPYFLSVILEGKGEFINGSRMVYPVPRAAMKFVNTLGNKVFSMIFSFLLGQTIKDTLCGTKVLWRSDWKRLKSMLGSWGTKDRWGDYELLFGAAKLHLKIVDLPVHYQERVFGTTKMTKVFRNGLIMLRMCFTGFIKLKMGF